MHVYDGDAVGVALGPSAYPSFPILPSLPPYLPIPYPTSLPTALYGSELVVEILELVPSAGLPLTLPPLRKQVIYVQCAAERR